MLVSTHWLVITEPYSEIIGEEILLGLKNNINIGDILWATEGYLDFIFMAYQKAIMMETLAEFHMGHLRVKQFAPLTTHYSVLLIIPNLENEFVVSKVHHLVYMIELLKAYQKIFIQWWKIWLGISEWAAEGIRKFRQLLIN